MLLHDNSTVIGSNAACTCGPWWGVLPPPPCPLHPAFTFIDPCTCGASWGGTQPPPCPRHGAHEPTVTITTPNEVIRAFDGAVLRKLRASDAAVDKEPWRCPGCKRWNAPGTPSCCSEDPE